MPVNQVSLDGILAELAKAQAGPGADYEAAAQQNSALLPQIAEANYQMGSQITAAGIVSKQAENAREADAQAKMFGVIKKLGLNPEDDASQFSQLARTLDQKQQQLQMDMLEMEKLRGVSLADNPIQWVVNQIQLDQKSDQFDQHSKEANLAAKLMHERAAAGSEAMQTVLAMKQVKSQEERDAELQSIALTSQIKLNQQMVSDRLTGAAALKETLGSSLESIRMKTQIYSLKAEAAEKARQRTLDAVNLEAAQLRLAEAKKDIKMLSSYEALVRQTGERLYGKPIDSRMPLKALEADPGISAALIPMAATGGQAIGFGPYSSYQNVIKTGGSLLEPSWRANLRGYLSKATAEAEAAVVKSFMDKGKAPPKKPEELAALADKQMLKVAAEQANGYIDNFLPHAMAPIGFYGDQRVLKNTVLWKSILSKLPPDTKLSSEALTKYAAAAVDSGQMTSGRAAQELSAFAKVHQDIINQAVNPMLFGLPLLKHVYVPVTTPGTGLFGSGSVTRAADILNAGDAELVINARIAEAKKRATAEGLSYTEAVAQPLFNLK